MYSSLTKMVRLAGVLALALVTAGCGGGVENRAIEQGVADFHRLYNEENFAAIHAASDPSMKVRVTERALAEYLAGVRKKMGKAIDTSRATYQVVTCNGVTTTVATQNTSFEKGLVAETFTFQVSGPKAVMVTYLAAAPGL